MEQLKYSLARDTLTGVVGNGRNQRMTALALSDGYTRVLEYEPNLFGNITKGTTSNSQIIGHNCHSIIRELQVRPNNGPPVTQHFVGHFWAFLHGGKKKGVKKNCFSNGESPKFAHKNWVTNGPSILNLVLVSLGVALGQQLCDVSRVTNNY